MNEMIPRIAPDAPPQRLSDNGTLYMNLDFDSALALLRSRIGKEEPKPRGGVNYQEYKPKELESC
ncbi:MAG: hypothetical protein NC115_12065 [Bacteroidales bacterium]|nr:hypothetical protein [Bacteroidales bacterium]